MNGEQTSLWDQFGGRTQESGRRLTCSELVELVTEYLEGRLSPAARTRFDEHIARCRGCTAYLDQMRITIRLTGTLAPEDISARARRALLSAFRGWKATRSLPPPPVDWATHSGHP